MFSRSTIASINRSVASGQARTVGAVALDAPAPCSRGFRPLPSGAGAGHPSPAFCASRVIEMSGLLVRTPCSALRRPVLRLLWPLLTSAARPDASQRR